MILAFFLNHWIGLGPLAKERTLKKRVQQSGISQRDPFFKRKLKKKSDQNTSKLSRTQDDQLIKFGKKILEQIKLNKYTRVKKGILKMWIKKWHLLLILKILILISTQVHAVVMEYTWHKKETDVAYEIEFYSDQELKNLQFKEYLKAQAQEPKITFKMLGTTYVKLKVKKTSGPIMIRSIFKLFIEDDRIKGERISGEDVIFKERIIPERERNNSLFYAMSSGRLNETGVQGQRSKVSQDSLFTLGHMNKRKISEKTFLSSSLYLSHLLARYKDQKENAFESGLNSYLEYDLKDHNTLPYLGLDIEMFPIINTDELAPNKDFTLLHQRLLYFTFGISQKFLLKERPFLLKGSLSPTLYSFGDKNTVNNKNYRGHKFILFLTTPLTKYWGLQVFYKKHTLSEAGELSLDRYGVGVNYSY